jgi:O-antigen/teichoic acid export membrane protein
MFYSYIAKIKKSLLVRHIAVLTSGSIFAQLIGVLASPILARIYTPQDFGLFGTLLAVTGVVSTVSSLKYEIPLVFENDDSVAKNIQALCLFLLILFTITSALAFYFVPQLFPNLIEQAGLINILPFGSIIILTTGLFNIISSRLNRERHYALLAKANIVQKLATVSTQVFLGYSGAAVLGLIFGNVIGLALAILLISIVGKFNLALTSVNKNNIIAAAKLHFRFPLYTTPQNILSSFSLSLPIYVLGYFYGMETVGFYWFSMRILHLPGRFVGQSIHQVFTREASGLINDRTTLNKRFNQMTLLLFLIIIFPTIIIVIWGPYLFAYVFGDNWIVAGELSQWLCLVFAVVICNPPTMAICQILKKNDLHLKFEIIQTFGRFFSLVIPSIFFMSIYVTVASFSLFGAVSNILFIFYVKKNILSKVGLKKLEVKCESI